MTVKKDFPQYTWGCVKTLDRRLRHFALNYIDYDTPPVQGVIAQELDGPGSLLGVRAMTKKLRIHHNIKVPRNLVNAAMFDADQVILKALRIASLVTEGKKEMESFPRLVSVGYGALTGTTN